MYTMRAACVTPKPYLYQVSSVFSSEAVVQLEVPSESAPVVFLEYIPHTLFETPHIQVLSFQPAMM